MCRNYCSPVLQAGNEERTAESDGGQSHCAILIPAMIGPTLLCRGGPFPTTGAPPRPPARPRAPARHSSPPRASRFKFRRPRNGHLPNRPRRGHPTGRRTVDAPPLADVPDTTSHTRRPPAGPGDAARGLRTRCHGGHGKGKREEQPGFALSRGFAGSSLVFPEIERIYNSGLLHKN
ncbi:hypothetical protein ABZP36_018334 [Zizania latifolia]